MALEHENNPEKKEPVTPDPKQPENGSENGALREIADAQREKIFADLEKGSLEALMEYISEKELGVRNHERTRVTKNSSTSYPQHGKPLDGEYFIEDLGVSRTFTNGTCSDFIYDWEGIGMRNQLLQQHTEHLREDFFKDLADLLPENKTILDIGAGMDMAPIRAFLKAGHRVIATDAGKSIMNNLAKKTGIPTFACDLENIGEIVPGKSIDYLFANSTLGYIDPRKLPGIVEQLCSIMREGGVFTFDMAPHPTYFRIAEKKEISTVINDSDMDPNKVIEFVEKYGVQEGIAATMYYYIIRHAATQVGTLLWLSELFENNDLHTQIGVRKIEENGSSRSVYTLRVAQGSHPIVMDSSDETFIVDNSFWNSIDLDNTFIPLTTIDRQSGSRLAKLFRLNVSHRRAPWEVVHFFHAHYDPSALTPETRDTIRSFFDPTVVCDRLQAASENGNFSQGLSLDPTIVIDQGIRKQVLLGLLFAEYPEDEAMHMADVIIDQKIDEIKKRRHTDQQIAIQQKEKEKRREKKKKNKRR